MRRSVRQIPLILAALVLLLAAAASAAQAQPRTTVTDDEVNAIAKDLYCPVCENITLDACGTAACDDWRYEIRLQLEAGLDEEAIKADFVRRFGDRVVGTPYDPVLRAISLVTPFLAVAVGGYLFLRYTRRSQRQPALHRLDRLKTEPPGGDTTSADSLRAQIERDIET